MERIDKLKEMLAAQPGDSFLRHALALEYIKAGDDAQARFLFEQLLAADENYIGSYYHLAGLLGRNGQTAEALSWYRKGMQKASEAGDRHTYNELKAAYEELVDD